MEDNTYPHHAKTGVKTVITSPLAVLRLSWGAALTPDHFGVIHFLLQYQYTVHVIPAGHSVHYMCIDIFFPVEKNGYFPKILKGFSGLKK